jgi:hypothetical protein
LGVATDVCWHGDLCILDSIGQSEGSETLWWVTHRSNGNIFDNEVCILKIWFSVLWAKVQVKIDILSSWDLSASWLDSIMDIFVLKSDFLLIFLFIDAPMERYENW